MLGLLVVLGLWALACTTWHVFAQDDAAGANATDDLAQDWLADTAYEDTLDEFAYGGDGLDLFDNNYYQDEMQEYYDHSGTYSDAFGEDYFFDDVPPASAECTETDAGKANLTGEPAYCICLARCAVACARVDLYCSVQVGLQAPCRVKCKGARRMRDHAMMASTSANACTGARVRAYVAAG